MPAEKTYPLARIHSTATPALSRGLTSLSAKYYDGNGARLLKTLILHLGGYELKGLYALEEYYACGLKDYYEALTVGQSHNYYMERAEADITGWVSSWPWSGRSAMPERFHWLSHLTSLTFALSSLRIRS